MDYKSYYSLVQFSAHPARFEFVNAGIVIIQPALKQSCVMMSPDAHHIKKLFDDQNAEDFKLKAQSFQKRIEHEFKANPSVEALNAFAASRANAFRLLPFLPIIVHDLKSDALRLFEQMISPIKPKKERNFAARKLEKIFQAEGVLDLVVRNPEPISINGLNQSLRADFGYQNGHYNMIDALSIPAGRELAILSQYTGKAQLVSQQGDRRLIIVADLGPSQNDLFAVFKNNLMAVHGKIYASSDLSPLVNDIRHQAHFH